MNPIFIVALSMAVVLLGINRYQWWTRRRLDREIDYLLSWKGTVGEVIQMQDIAHLPMSVQKWMMNCGVVGKRPVRSVKINQRGMMRLNPNQNWLPIEAEQVCRLDEPAFIWRAEMRFNRFLHIFGVDRFIEGRGLMRILLQACIPITETHGEELNQGTMIRFLDEMIWYPSMALSPYITWEEVDEFSARAKFTYKGKTVQGIFEFDEKGRVRNFRARRYMEKKGQFSLEDWSTPMGGYQRIDGIEIPTRGTVIWHLSTGDFRWLDMEITHVEYDAP